jgi:hypothetical protein
MDMETKVVNRLLRKEELGVSLQSLLLSVQLLRSAGAIRSAGGSIKHPKIDLYTGSACAYPSSPAHRLNRKDRDQSNSLSIPSHSTTL